jgi:hypothetical protein
MFLFVSNDETYADPLLLDVRKCGDATVAAIWKTWYVARSLVRVFDGSDMGKVNKMRSEYNITRVVMETVAYSLIEN